MKVASLALFFFICSIAAYVEYFKGTVTFTIVWQIFVGIIQSF